MHAEERLIERFGLGADKLEEIYEKIRAKDYTNYGVSRARNNRGYVRRAVVYIDGHEIRLVLSASGKHYGKIITLY